MRILFDANPLIPLTLEQGPRGIGRWTREVVSRLAQLEPTWELEGVLFKTPFVSQFDESLLGENLRIRRLALPYSAFRRLRTIGWLPPAEWIFGEFDAFLGPDFITWPCSKAAEIPVIHDLIPLIFPEFVSPKHHWFIRILLPRVLGRAALVIVDAEAIANEVGERYRGTRPKLRAIPAGFDDGQFEIGDDIAMALPSSYLLFVGTVEPRKNLSGVLEGVRIARNTMDVPPLLVVGAGSRLSDVPDLPDWVVAVGYVPDRALRAIYTNASALVFPSFYEGFGLPALEAMGAGCPVITSRRGGLPEAAGDAALYVDPEDPKQISEAIIRILSEPTLRAELTSVGLQRSKLFSWGRTAEGIRDVIQEAASARVVH